MICPTAATLQPLTCNDDDGGDDDAAGDAINDNDNGDDDDLLHTPTTDLQQDKLNSWVKFLLLCVHLALCNVECLLFYAWCYLCGCAVWTNLHCCDVQCVFAVCFWRRVYFQCWLVVCNCNVQCGVCGVAQICVVCDVQSAFAVCIWRSVHFQCGVCVELH